MKDGKDGKDGKNGKGAKGAKGALTVLCLACLGSPPVALHAQEAPGLAVYLFTAGPGGEIWERFGHNAIWIRDTVTGTGPAYDFGRFDFRSENFVLNFARGRMMYWMGRAPGEAVVSYYTGELDRSSWLQRLALSQEQIRALVINLEAQFARDSGRYAYDYYRDNCSTRIRDALDAVLGGAIRDVLDTTRTGTTYRWHTRRSLEPSLPYYFAVMTGLGPAVDQPITAWQASFLPMQLQEHLGRIRVRGPDGMEQPLVTSETQVHVSREYSVADSPSNRPRWMIAFVGLALGAALLLLGRAGRSRAGARRAFRIVAGGWELFATGAGLLLVFLWAASDHEVAYRNANLFQFNAVALLLLVAIPRSADPAWYRIARWGAWLAAGLAIVGLILALRPGIHQQNAEIAALACAVHLGVLAGLLALAATSLSSSAAPRAPR